MGTEKRHSSLNKVIQKKNISFIFLAVLAGFTVGKLLADTLGLAQSQWLLSIGAGIGSGIIWALFLKRKKTGEMKKEENGRNKTDRTWPVIEATVEDVRKAIREYSAKLPKGVYRTILARDDNSIDFEQLAPILKGIPSKKFYLSKETYDIFEESEKEFASVIDKVQKAVDVYVNEHKDYPVLPFDPLKRVNYYKLLQTRCLDEEPSIELYLTDLDGLVSHRKPEKQETGN